MRIWRAGRPVPPPGAPSRQIARPSDQTKSGGPLREKVGGHPLKSGGPIGRPGGRAGPPGHPQIEGGPNVAAAGRPYGPPMVAGGPPVWQQGGRRRIGRIGRMH